MSNQLIPEVVRDFLESARGLPHESAPRPDDWTPRMHEARALKNRGAYEQSAQGYIALMGEHQVVYCGVVRALYQAVASAGYLADALALALFGKQIYDRNPSPNPISQSLPSAYHCDVGRLLTGATSPEALSRYLGDIAGSARYELPRDYVLMVRELASACEVIGEHELQDLVWSWQQYERMNPSFEIRSLS